MTTPPKNRVPAGVPSGGQFAASQRSESDMRLDALDRETEYIAAYFEAYDGEPEAPFEPVQDVDGYSEARAAVDHDWNLLTENIEMLHPHSLRAERYNEVAEHFEAVARNASSSARPEFLPRPGQTVLNAHTGRVYAAADYAAQARLNAGYGAFKVEDINAGGDRISQTVFDTRDFTTANGIEMRARIVRRGQAYGRSGSLVAEKDLVFFFDARYPNHPSMIGSEFDEQRERNGQHITHYNLATLTEAEPGGGLNLYGGEPDWTIDAATYRNVQAWMRQRAY